MNQHNEAQLDRRHILACNSERILAAMTELADPDPVGMVLDVGDFQGRQMALAAGVCEAEIDAHIERCRGLHPTVVLAFPLEIARKLLPNTSPTAENSMTKLLKMRQPGQYIAVCIAAKGNAYTLLDLPFVKDGQHRHVSN